MKPNHTCDPARMALLYIRQQFICTTFKFDAYELFAKAEFNYLLYYTICGCHTYSFVSVKF